MEYELIIGSILIALSWAISAIIQKDILQHIGSITLLFYVSLIFFVMMSIVMILEQDIVYVGNPYVDYYRWLEIFMIAMLGFLLPNYILFRLVKTNDVNRVVALSYISPMMTTILAWLLLYEDINIYSVIGVALIVIGAILIVTKTKNTA